jgi:hypothetical protein
MENKGSYVCTPPVRFNSIFMAKYSSSFHVVWFTESKVKYK